MSRRNRPDLAADVHDRLTLEGWTIIRTRSHQRTLEELRAARAGWQNEIVRRKDTEGWAHDSLDEERRLRDRCTYLYGLAARLGATDEQLQGPT